ncbi:MAG TPA: glycosyltransferase family 2 protein [Gemmataceae bacterium]|nr:glycosyltransferase family 2 protein [Gemmataceae bacterium]
MDQQTDRARISKEPISVLLPVYNQAAGLESIAENWLRALSRLERPIEFVVIDDASTDDSAAIAGKLAGRHPEMRVLKHDQRQGYGAALRMGIASTSQPLVFYTACNYPYPPADLVKLLEVIDGADVVSGCRTDPVPGWLRRLGSAYRLFARVVFGVEPEARPGWRGWAAWREAFWLRLTFGLRLWDPMSAYKLFRRSVLERIPIQSNGEFVHAELLAKANFMGCLMAEVSIGRLPGNFKGVAEPPAAGTEVAREARTVFRRPVFAVPKPPETPENEAGQGL